MLAVKIANKFLEPRTFQIFRAVQTAPKQRQLESVVASAQEIELAKPFDSIPGPKPLPIPYVGNLWRLMPFGSHGKMDMIELHKSFYDEYGPLVRFIGLGSFDQVIVFEPENAEKLFRNESIWPQRYPLQAVKYYRTKMRKDFYKGAEGLITSNGEEWRTFRTATNPVLMQPINVKPYLDAVVTVCDDFIERIRHVRNSDGEMPKDFINEINKMSLETFAFMTLDKRLGCFSNDLPPDSEPMQMIKNVTQMMSLMYVLEVGSILWRVYPTPEWKQFVSSMDFIVEFTNKQIMEKWEKIKNQKEDKNLENRSLLESMLLQTKDPKVAIVMASDTLFAAVDTTSTTMATTLYHLATNPDKQEKLFQELKNLLPRKDSPITHEIANELKYTRAAIKESMRLNPTSIANQRTTETDLVFSGYLIPKGTTVVVSHGLMCRMEKYFKRAGEFLPERWLKSEVNSDISYKRTHPFTYLPFGFGVRSCIGKRFAYMEMDVVISKIIRNFNVTWEHEPMIWDTKFIMRPMRPLRFKMTERPQ